MSESKTKKAKTSKKRNVTKKGTLENSISTQKQKVDDRTKPGSFFDLVKTVYFSVPARPAWIGFILGFGLYIIVGEGAIYAMGFIIGLSVCLSGWLAIQRREYPLWTHMATGSTAVFYGWLALIGGAGLLIPSLCRLFSR